MPFILIKISIQPNFHQLFGNFKIRYPTAKTNDIGIQMVRRVSSRKFIVYQRRANARKAISHNAHTLP